MHLVYLLIRLHKESALEAERIGELVGSLGVEHQILRLEWDEWKGGQRGRRREGGQRRGELPPNYVIMEKVRRSMLSFCQSMDIRTLMTAHHLDDQIGKRCFNRQRT